MKSIKDRYSENNYFFKEIKKRIGPGSILQCFEDGFALYIWNDHNFLSWNLGYVNLKLADPHSTEAYHRQQERIV